MQISLVSTHFVIIIIYIYLSMQNYVNAIALDTTLTTKLFPFALMIATVCYL